MKLKLSKHRDKQAQAHPTLFLNEQPQPQQTRFQHSPLTDPRSDIRLIRISNVIDSPDASASPVIEVELFHTPLASAGNYIAISYAWGDPTPVRRLFCNGAELYVPENTFRVLYTIFHCSRKATTALYNRGDTFTLWIDALCINQQDVSEKNCQVPMMGKIYQLAKGAIGYVGSPSEGTDPNNAIHSMAWWANCPIIKPPDDLTTDQTDPRFQEWLEQAKKAGVGDLPETLGRDLTDLWSNEWFVRCWVTQEMVLPRDVVCLYGYGVNSCSWNLDLLTIMVDRAQNVQHVNPNMYKIGKSFNNQLLEKAIHVDAWRVMREELKSQESKRDFIALLHRSRRTKATDQRDMIYSLFGLMKEEDRAAIRVDYSPSHTVTEVFMDVARYCISTRYGPNLLVEAGISHNVPNLPSWAPDWTTMGRTPLNTGIYNACLNLYKPIELLPDGKRIKVTGRKVETVAYVGIPVNYPYGVLESGGKDPSTEPYDVASILIAAAVVCEPAREKYPQYPIRNEDWSEVLRRTCAVDRHWSGRRLTPADRPEYDNCLKARGFGDDIFEAIKEDGRAVSQAQLGEKSRFANSLPYGVVVSEFSKGRVIALLKGGLLGSMPSETRIGDVVVVLFGGWVPFVVRPLEDDEYELVGHCYIHGIMDGEWIEAVLASMTNPDECVFDEFFNTFYIR
jgi:hypothetical protein